MNIAPFSPVKFRINVFYCKLWTPRTTLAVVWADNVHPKSCDETKIDSHAHVERDWFLATLPCILCISTHTLTWSVTLPFFWKLSAEVNFNSHAHVERDWAIIWHSVSSCISTHTLTWSVTSSSMWSRQTLDISTHTLTWSVTGGVFVWWMNILHFNSHAHVERDRAAPQILLPCLHFNSHAHVERD